MVIFHVDISVPCCVICELVSPLSLICIDVNDLIINLHASSVSHETLPCLRPCTRNLFCGHKCSRNCTEKCRCAEDCRDFHLQQAERQLAKLQIQGDVGQEHGRASEFESRTRNNSPEKWQQFSRDPQVHDDAIRQTRLQGMKEQEFSTRPLIDLGTTAITGDCESGGKASDTIHEKFIPIANQDGHRIIGEAQVVDGLGDVSQPTARAKQQNRRQAQRSQSQNPRQAGQGQRAGSQQYRQLAPEPSAAAQDVARDISPEVRRTRQIAESTVGESDLGFEAEVLGIRRGPNTQSDQIAFLEQDLHQSHTKDKPETIISFDELDAAQLRVATGPKQLTTPTGKDDDDDLEPLIDI